MQILHKKLELKLNYPLHRPYQKEEIVFFDIETTGLLASASYLYLIGAMYYKENSWHLTQWFANDMQSEKLILDAFFSFLVSFKMIVHYNGSSFDLPYIEKKCKQYKIDCPFSSVESLDLYKKLHSCKKLLPVSNLKLKTMETFAGIHREDKLSGEELIQIYANYIGKYQFEQLQLSNNTRPTSIPKFQKDVKTLEESIKSCSSEELQSLLLLHNAEDVTGLLKISNILYYTDIFENTLQQKVINFDFEYNIENNIVAVILKQELPFSFGKTVTIETNVLSDNATSILLYLYHNELTIHVPIYYGELKYFPDNYKDYYYLPTEDMVVHKSVAQFVDKEFRQKVVARNCFLKKSASFLPLPEAILLPIYHLEYKDKISYAEFNPSDFNNVDFMNRYFHSLLGFIKINGIVKN